jgi:hypothetical protein
MAPGVSLLRAWFVCAALAALWACGDPSSTPARILPDTRTVDQPPSTTENPCLLLTKADAEAALGAAVEDIADESKPMPMGDKALLSRCYYDGDGGSVALSVTKHIDAAYAAERFAKLKDRHDTDPSFRPLYGLGEDAFAEHDSLHVKRGDLLLSIQLRLKGERKLKHYGDIPGLDALAADERRIAEAALRRLPPAPTS